MAHSTPPTDPHRSLAPVYDDLNSKAGGAT
jgi:hypothetical protein